MKNFLKIMYRFMYLILILSSTILKAQVGVGIYQQNEDNYYLYNNEVRYDFVVATDQIRMNYNPSVPLCSKTETLISRKGKLITNDYAESNASKDANKLVSLSDIYADKITGGTSPNGLRLNIYYPVIKAGFTTMQEPLPLIIYGYGCGFMTLYRTSRKECGQRKTAQWLANKGYIVIVPEYRIGLNITDRELGKRAVWRGVQDIRKVIRFCRLSNRLQNEKYRVALDKPITYMGYSAGAIAGLSNLYYKDQNKEPSMGNTYNFLTPAPHGIDDLPFFFPQTTYDLGNLDDVMGDNSANADFGGNPTNTNISLNVQDITISVSGGIGDVAVLPQNVPKALFLIHHRSDGIVPCGDSPYTKAKEVYRGMGLFNTAGTSYPLLFGSCSINSYYSTNTAFKPPVYSYKYMDKNCSSIACIKGDAGSEYARNPFGNRSLFKTNYHEPINNKAKTDGVNYDSDVVLMEILHFLLDKCSQVRPTLIPNNLISARNSVGIKDGLTGLTTQETAKSIEIFPNPVLDDIMNITSIDNNTPYRIINMLGQEVGSGKVENESINVAQLSQGTYSVELKTKNQRIVKRFIKQ